MQASQDYWAKAQAGSPGTMLAEMQQKLYAGETTTRLMEKFDHKLQTFTMGITDPVELEAAKQRAEALLAEKLAIAAGLALEIKASCACTRPSLKKQPRSRPALAAPNRTRTGPTAPAALACTQCTPHTAPPPARTSSSCCCTRNPCA